jgi:DNA repair protein RadA/Sms
MAKVRTSYVCRECGNVQPKWMGKCPDCGAWDALERFVERDAADGPAPGALDLGGVLGAGPGEAPAPGGSSAGGTRAPGSRRAVPIAEVKPLDVPRIPSGIDEFDRVLGGGIVPGSVTLLGGDPGIGKSTLLLQAAAALAGRGRRVLYATSEESAAQVKLRADRLDGSADAARGANLLLLAEPNLAVIAEEARRTRPDLLVLDSIQLTFRGDVDAPPGSLQQLRRCCLDLVSIAKTSGTAVAMVGHVTKEGDLAGPKLLEHLVDVVLAFEGDRHHAYRVVRAVKNRFGSTQEVGLFEMTGAGLSQVEEATLAPDAGAATGDGGSSTNARPTRPGSVFTPVLAGSRVLLAEVQALTATGFLGNAKRRASGLDAGRLAMLIAVLEKHGGLRLGDQDIYASAVGGMRIVEPAADLAIALAVAGAFHDRGAGASTAAIGEISLSGELRSVRQLEQRVQAAVRRGAGLLLVPRAQAEAARAALQGPSAGSGAQAVAQVVAAASIRDALDHLA